MAVRLQKLFGNQMHALFEGNGICLGLDSEKLYIHIYALETTHIYPDLQLQQWTFAGVLLLQPDHGTMVGESKHIIPSCMFYFSNVSSFSGWLNPVLLGCQ